MVLSIHALFEWTKAEALTYEMRAEFALETPNTLVAIHVKHMFHVNDSHCVEVQYLTGSYTPVGLSEAIHTR